MARARMTTRETGKVIAKERKGRKVMANKEVAKIIMGIHWHRRHLMEEKFVMPSTLRVAGADADVFMFAESLDAMGITVQESIRSMLAMTRRMSDYLRSQPVRLQQDLERR